MKNLKYIAAVLILILSSCSGEKKNKIITQTANADTVATKEDIYLNQKEMTPVNDVARLLAGKATDKYADIQEKDYYTEYSTTINQQWKELTSKTLEPIETWKQQNINDLTRDTSCLFYPFGGPDLLFALTFFPNMNNYVLFGLENPGALPDVEQLSEKQIKDYLDNLSYSFRYVNKFGFFVASHMKDDFNNHVLNGTLHLMLYTLAMKNCNITSYRQIKLDNVGNVVNREEETTKNPYGYEIKFYKDGETNQRTIYYLRLDASNTPMSEHLEFAYFIKTFPQKTCYLKSASYLLQDVDFTIVRKIITDQCDKIVQDESGIAYSLIKKDYNVRLYGTYTRPMKVFSKFKQEDLRQELANIHSTPLPFKIGYASQINESVIMACKRKTKKENNSQSTAYEMPKNYSKDTVYKVQFKVSWKQQKIDDPKIKHLPDLDYYTDGSYYKYTAGNKKSEEECQPILQELKKAGYNDAFIIKIYNGKRIK